MNRVIWKPVRTRNNDPFDRFFNELWSAVNENGGQPVQARPSAVTPAMDVIENEHDIQLVIDLPGVNPDHVNIEVNKGVLTLTTAQPETDNTDNTDNTAENKNVAYQRRERYHGSYQRSVRLPETIDAEQVTANFENGVLTLTLPKKPEAQPIRIPVNAAQG